MKTIHFALVLCLMLFLQTLSSAQKTYIDSAAYAKSFAIWEQGKKEHNNSYEFSLVFASFSGYSNKTTFTVKEGKFVKRAFEENFGPHSNREKKPEKWVETGDKIGSHENAKGLITMEAIYAYAKNYVGTKDPAPIQLEEENAEKPAILEFTIKVFFSTDMNGILSTAGTVPDGCMDDCFNGYRVRGFKWL